MKSFLIVVALVSLACAASVQDISPKPDRTSEEMQAVSTVAPPKTRRPLLNFKEQFCKRACKNPFLAARVSAFCNCPVPEMSTPAVPAHREQRSPTAEGIRYKLAICRQICRRDPSLGGHYCNCDQFPMLVFSGVDTTGQKETADGLLTNRVDDNEYFVREKRI